MRLGKMCPHDGSEAQRDQDSDVLGARELTPEPVDWDAREKALTESTFERYQADELTLYEASRLWTAEHAARCKADPVYRRYAEAKCIRRLEEEAREAEAAIARLPDREAPGMRWYAAERRKHAREYRVQLVRELRTLRSSQRVTTTTMRGSVSQQQERPRERRARPNRSGRRARAPSRDPDEPAPPLGRLSPLDEWGGVIAAAVRMHAHVLRRAAAMRVA
jgi:hypothetical protein